MTSKDRGEEVRWRIDMWNAKVERAHSITILYVRSSSKDLVGQCIQKNIYWKTIGCCARRRKWLLPSSLVGGFKEVCFSMRVQVR